VSSSWGQTLIGQRQNGSLVGGVASGNQYDCPGGLMVIAAAASAWNGATATLNMLGPDGSTLMPVSPTQATFVGNGVGAVYLPPCIIQMTVSGGTPTALFVSIARVVN
jgi:hypothetical protein